MEQSTGAQWYVIYKSPYSNELTYLDTTSDTTYFDSIGNISSRYYYNLAATNSRNTSSGSGYIRGGLISIPLAPMSFSAQ